MFDFLGFVMEVFLWVWIAIIATIPGIFMNGLAICVVATVMTYFIRRTKTE